MKHIYFLLLISLVGCHVCFASDNYPENVLELKKSSVSVMTEISVLNISEVNTKISYEGKKEQLECYLFLNIPHLYELMKYRLKDFEKKYEESSQGFTSSKMNSYHVGARKAAYLKLNNEFHCIFKGENHISYFVTKSMQKEGFELSVNYMLNEINEPVINFEDISDLTFGELFKFFI